MRQVHVQQAPADTDRIQALLGYSFKEPQLLERALTHRSTGAAHNERLEFLGDAVLDLAVSQLLYRRFTSLPEGDLSRIRAALVCGRHLQELALTLGLDRALKLGTGERKSGGQRRASNLANALEAVLGAVYLDGGYDRAQQVIQKLFASVDWDTVHTLDQRDAKTQLQEWLQARQMPLPVYELLSVEGPEHQLVFTVGCRAVNLQLQTEGQGSSKRQAQQQAAAGLLLLLLEDASTRSPTDKNTRKS